MRVVVASACAAALALGAGCTCRGTVTSPPPPGPGWPPLGEPSFDESAEVFDLGALHEIALEIDPALYAQLDADHETRVPANITYDGVRLQDIGIREKCGIGSCTTIADKVSFSIKFDEFVGGLKLHGLDKLVLNNEIQDPSYSNELMGQELARRAGLPAPRVAYADVTLNGAPYGLFVVVESVDKEFLRRHFGHYNDEGNLYEGQCCGDFVWDPYFPELKDEAEGRTRDDLIALADFIASTPDDVFAAGLDARMDVAGYLTSYAVSALVYHWDGYEYNTNNYYIYDNPVGRRFVFWLHGMDQLFYDCGWPVDAVGPGRLGQRVLEIPALRDAFHAELTRILDDVWDEAEMVSFLDAAVAVYGDAAAADPRHPLDAGRLDAVRTCLATRPSDVRDQLAAVCGDGVVGGAEECDDGNVTSGDGCTAGCRSECGDGQLQPGETCDDGNRFDGDGCSAVCLVEPGCGDGILDLVLGEQCDDAMNGENFADGCRDDCTANLCGDGRLDLGEACDDGNAADGDGCSAACVDEDGVAVCGNGLLEAGEGCDDANFVPTDACDNACQRPCTGADTAVVASLNGHCYLGYETALDWFTAEGFCEARGGHLVTVTSRAESTLAQGATAGDRWLGLTDLAVEGTFAWVTGEPFVYSGFRPGEPNDWGGNEDCGHFAWDGWNDLDCLAGSAYVCELE
jgi:spore coat protein H